MESCMVMVLFITNKDPFYLRENLEITDRFLSD